MRISAKYFPVVEFAGVAGTAVIIGYGGWLSSIDVVTVGTVAAFVLYLNNLFEPVQQLSQLYNTVQSAGAALQKIFGVLDTKPSVAERPGAVDLPRPRRDRRRARDVRVRRAIRCCTTSRCTIACGRAHRARRPDRCRQVDAREADRALLRPDRRRRAASTASTCATRRFRSLRKRDRRRAAGGVPVRGHVARQRARRPTGSHRRRSRRRALVALGLLERFHAFPDGLDDRSARARLAPVGRRAPARVARARRARRPERSSCSTKRRRTSTPAPSTRSRPRSNG